MLEKILRIYFSVQFEIIKILKVNIFYLKYIIS